MKSLSSLLVAIVSIFGGVIGSAAACPVATNVVAIQAVAAPVVVSAVPVVVQPAPLVYPATVTVAVPTIAVQAAPVLIEQVVKVKPRRAFRTPVRSLLFR